MKTFKNKTDQVQVVSGVGIVEANGTITVPDEKAFENPNFEEISAPQQPVQQTQTPPQTATQNVKSVVEGGTK